MDLNARSNNYGESSSVTYLRWTQNIRQFNLVDDWWEISISIRTFLKISKIKQMILIYMVLSPSKVSLYYLLIYYLTSYQHTVYITNMLLIYTLKNMLNIK